ncbi:hypothetical protein AAJ76_100044073 [Vairimorpha ceranae]|uniref:Uncharacterized protein n=1 Tax=Vairimorpha ceranae TaxID=40302 RepID=A0A0F9WV66_9MICR|nr:hypothetical protein AAJ76_100044073 [Vairimorpha ceranae]KAF5141646.1 hypothetical protein G9O61_00g001880 [Vairimorpha ceranae]KKO76633.1 hypothetical protein AAJ76_100044073 [Vairimorpha ceranae]
MGDNKKFYMSGIQEYIDETQDDTDLYFKYGVYLASTGAKFDISLFNDKVALLNFLKKEKFTIKRKKKNIDW